MYIFKAQNAAATKISVTTAATNLFDLINTAGSTNLPLAGYPNSVNAVNILVEDGDVRFLMDGNTPTSTEGFKLSSGTVATLRNVPLTAMQLISTGGTVSCSVEVGTSNDGESTVIGGSGGSGSSSSSASAEASSGNDEYTAKPSGTNADGTVAYTSGTTITVTGLPFTFTEYDIELIEQIPTTGNVKTFTDKADFAVSSGVITVTGASFAASDEFVVKFKGPVRAYDTSGDSTRTLRTNTEYNHYQEHSHLIDVSNIADTTTHYAYVDQRSYKNGFLQGIFGGTDTITVKVATSGETDVAITSATYVDSSTDILGAASKTADFGVFLDSQIVAPYIRVEYVSNNSASDGDLKITYNQA